MLKSNKNGTLLGFLLVIVLAIVSITPVAAQEQPANNDDSNAVSNRIMLPLVSNWIPKATPTPTPGPITQESCQRVGGKVTPEFYPNGTSFVAIDKMRSYIPRATEAMNSSYFPNGYIHSSSGSSQVCYFPGNYLVVWPNPQSPVSQSDIEWFPEHPSEVTYLEFTAGQRPEGNFGGGAISASGVYTDETLYTMVMAYSMTAVEDLNLIGTIRIGGETGSKIWQIAKLGGSRFTQAISFAGNAWAFSQILDRIWTSTALGTTTGALLLNNEAVFIQATKVSIDASVYLWFDNDALSKFEKYPIGESILALMPKTNQKWGWYVNTKPQFSNQKAYSMDEILYMLATVLATLERKDIHDETQQTLEDQLEELNKYAREQLGKKPRPVPGPLPDDNSRYCKNAIVQEDLITDAIAWIFAWVGMERVTPLPTSDVLLYFEFIESAKTISWQTRYEKIKPWPIGTKGQLLAINKVNGKEWIIYGVCSSQSQLTQKPAVWSYDPMSGKNGLSNNIDNPNEHKIYIYAPNGK